MGCDGVGMYHVGDPFTAGRDGLELAYQYQRGFDVHAAAMLCAATAQALRRCHRRKCDCRRTGRRAKGTPMPI